LLLRWNGKKWARATIPSIAAGGVLAAVTATSASNAWAVGAAFTSIGEKTMILHWNGTKWARVASPNPQGKTAEVTLDGVAATSASNAWAVGDYATVSGDKSLILHWNGRAWKQVPSPNPGLFRSVLGIAATSAKNAWAMGTYNTHAGQKTLILHWNGRAWKQVPSPNPGTVNELTSVAAVSTSNIWAVGDFGSGGPNQVLIAHCC